MAQHELWIEMGAWQLNDGNKSFHCEQSRRKLRQAAGVLDGQKLVAVTLEVSPLATVFEFEYGGTLLVHPQTDADPTDPLWHMYNEDRFLELTSDGHLEYGLSSSKRKSARCKVTRARYIAQQVAAADRHPATRAAVG